MKRRLAVAATLTALALLLREPQRVYTLFLPMVAKPLNLSRGVAWSQTGGAMLGATWCYNGSGGVCYENHHDFRSFSPCPSLALLGNEPEWGEPVDAAWAAGESRKRKAECPGTVFIAGNTVEGDYRGWMVNYLNSGGIADYVGTHCYGTAQRCIDVLTDFKQRFSGYRQCVSEFGIGSGNADEFRRLMRWINDNFECSAVYTDVAPPEWAFYNLLTDGMPNELGRIYRDR